jgi:hypothetical protein
MRRTKTQAILAMAFFAVGFLAFAVFSVSCRKGDPVGIIQSDNAPPGIQNIRDFSISEFEDTIDLKFRFNSFSDIVYSRYKYSWTCIEYPSGAKAPVLLNRESPEGKAYGMVPGIYQFQIEANNKKGKSTETFQVTVLKDTLKGKFVYLPEQVWLVEDSVVRIGAATWTRYNPKLITSPERPDLFFRKLEGITFSYRNAGDSEWKTLEGFEIAIIEQKVFWSKFTNAPENWKALNGKKAEMRLYFR